MNIEAHMAVGWVLGNLLPGSSRLERLGVFAAAVLSDADGLSYLAGEDAYANWHHTFGHSLLLAGPLFIAAMLLARHGRRLAMALLVPVAFATHLVGDYFLSGWEVQLLWPLDQWIVRFEPRIGLDHPINVWLSYGSFAFMAISLWWVGRTPLEFIWPKLDRLLGRVAARRTAACHICGRHTGIACDDCGRPMCLRDTLVKRGYRLVCRSCASRPADAITPASRASRE